MAEVQIPISLGNRIIFVENVKAKPSSHRSRAPGFLRIAPIDSGQQITELGRGDRHRAVGRARPQEAAPFQPLRKQAGSLAVMPITFKRSPRRPRKQNNCPLSGSRRSTSCTFSDRLAKPFLMSVWPVASHTRTPLGTGIMAAFQ